jgi:VWFA-related protein
MFKRAVLILVCLKAPILPGLAAQGPANPTFRTGAKLVQVSVIAQDKQGKPVADLRREDFQLFDNGAPQEIRLFLSDTGGPTSPPPLRSTVFTNQIAQRTGSRSGYSVILFDNLLTHFGAPGCDGTSYGARMALRALQAIPEGENVALYAIGWKLRILREFTTDRDSLQQLMDKWVPSPDTLEPCSGDNNLQTAPDTLPPSESPFERMTRLASQTSRGSGDAAVDAVRPDTLNRIAAFNQELTQIADHLAGVPGRKNLIWMADRFPITGGLAIQRLINAGVAIYPVDEQGVDALISSKREPMRRLAEETGGVPFFGRSDLDVAVREAIDDGRVSYTLGFYQPGDDAKAMVHQLRIRVSRPGVSLRYRSSYQGEPPASKRQSLQDLVEAMNRPVDSTAISITASATRTEDRLKLAVRFDAANLDLEPAQGLWKGKAEVVARFLSADGMRVGEVLSETATFNLKPATYASMLTNGIPYQKEWKIPTNAVELKLLVGNLATGKIGTLTIPLPQVQEAGVSTK